MPTPEVDRGGGKRIVAIITEKIVLRTNGKTDIVDITGQVASLVKKAALKNGSAVVFVPGSTAGITTIEYEPGLVEDLKSFFEKIASESAKYQHNIRWQDGNGYSHVRAAFLKPSLTIPFTDRKLNLGTWQQIVLIDFDNRPREREMIVQIIGE